MSFCTVSVMSQCNQNINESNQQVFKIRTGKNTRKQTNKQKRTAKKREKKKGASNAKQNYTSNCL